MYIVFTVFGKKLPILEYFNNLLGTFSYVAKALPNFKVLEKLMNGYLDAHTGVNFKVCLLVRPKTFSGKISLKW